jgi:hypothetical protein
VAPLSATLGGLSAAKRFASESWFPAYSWLATNCGLSSSYRLTADGWFGTHQRHPANSWLAAVLTVPV